MAKQAPTPKTTDGHPRHALLRASLHQASIQNAELQAPARSVEAEDGHQAFGFLRAFAGVASPDVARTTDRGRSNATHWLRNTEADEKPCQYANEQLLRAAALRAAQFQISRMFALRSIERRLSKVFVAANTQLAGWRRGRQIGLISLIFEATEINGADFDGTRVTHQIRRLLPGAFA